MTMEHEPLTITSANSVLMLRCKGVYDEYVRIRGFQGDNAWGFGESNIAEDEMGVDGLQSIGYTPHTTPWTLYLQANSPSNEVLENIRADFNQNKEARYIDIIVEIPSIKKRYSSRGTLISFSGGTSGKKVLAGSQYNFSLVINNAERIG
ncbi:hypothetical protein AAEX37_01955 [Oligella sp. MSHR50489EDL]|uniref:phage tail fiber protein n=1 Tax=Oligella sp. MSHR50489EDL TaxID=3139409 RepID=UPI003D81325B